MREEYRADTAEELARARQDVKLEMRQEGGTVHLYLDGPFRDRNNREFHRGESYRFRHDFDVQVPRDIALNLKTVNGQEIRGSERARRVGRSQRERRHRHDRNRGSGTMETVNGTVHATFVENPREPSRFKTLNGTIDVAFQPNLSADLRLSTMHGDAYTDFEVTGLATVPEVRRSEDGNRYRISDRRRTLRVAGGGIEHQFDTLNGSIKIRKYGKQQ